MNSDFDQGQGFSCWTKRFPLDQLKIDKSFVDEIDKDAKAVGMARAIITIGHGLGLTVVAEGVETQGQLTVLRERIS